ncbi:uncharacterized protein ATNIH1004_009244 [Aspergillus tanneri]|uniref:Caffeine resistance protein 5 n=1 Tax=Aspergillus tanneri TaxID=1220188 RepID=A0A5M9MJ97_9EURO|nr:uncharacterized protein ATNIH1004_009244 [Aspergillus tanneri]KAA8645033.1 hypothetical protein ATNIH1004_009244 [Aspergillus tanneri]
METIRDSAFGKLVRIFSGRRWLRYPEEIDPSIWTECLKTERQVTDEEAAALADSEVDSFGLYTVMSQVSSRVSRRLTSTSHGEYGEKRPPVVIDWRGLDDSEVRIYIYFPTPFSPFSHVLQSSSGLPGSCNRRSIYGRHVEREILLFFFLPETFSPNILYRRARRIRKITGNSNYMCEAEIELQAVRPQDVLFESLIRPFELCFLEPIIFLMNLYISLIYGILYIFFEAFPIIFGEIHSFNPGEIGLAFMGTLVGAFFTVFGYFFWKYKYQSQYFDEDGNITPEKQLPPACVGCFALPISLFWFGWTGNFESVHWIVPIVGSMFFSVGGFLIFNGIFCYQAHAYPKYAASVLAGNDFMRSSFGAAFPLFASAMFHNLGVGQIEIVKLLLFTNLVIKPG